MKQGTGRGKRTKNASKSLTRRDLRRIFYVGAAALAVVLPVCPMVFLSVPNSSTEKWESQMAWLRSSFIGQGVNNAQDV